MALETYKEKRNFENTPEPEAMVEGEREKLIFVVQRHQASHLHFDFRLEADGVLKSWAVPKGPSMNAKDKRLAVMVEDHPLEYARFEGNIPEGNYGAGIVEIWDSGTWKPKKGFENIEESLKKGQLEFFLEGEKLKGEFILISIGSTTKNGWLLRKRTDKFATKKNYDANEV